MKLTVLKLANKLRHLIGKALWQGPASKQDLIDIARLAEKRQIIQQDVLAIAERLLTVSDSKARDIMIPRVHMVTIDIESSLPQIQSIVAESGHSRFPVVYHQETNEEIEGVILAKDLLTYFADTKNKFVLHDVIRPVMHVPESIRLNVLLRKFQENRGHMAIVVNEYEGIAGLVTIEDVLEEIVGEIEDESDLDVAEWLTPISENEFLVDSHMDIDEFIEEVNVNIEDDVDTIGGFILKLAGKVPTVGETFRHENLAFEVTQADGRRIVQLRVTRDAPAA